MGTKVIYTYDLATREFIGSDIFDDDHKLIDGETEVVPEDGLYQPAIFNGTKWVGSDKDAYDAKIVEEQKQYAKDNLIPPSVEMQAINALGIQMAQLISGGTK